MTHDPTPFELGDFTDAEVYYSRSREAFLFRLNGDLMAHRIPPDHWQDRIALGAGLRVVLAYALFLGGAV